MFLGRSLDAGYSLLAVAPLDLAFGPKSPPFSASRVVASKRRAVAATGSMPNVRAMGPGARVEDLPLLNAPELEEEVRAAGFESPWVALGSKRDVKPRPSSSSSLGASKGFHFDLDAFQVAFLGLFASFWSLFVVFRRLNFFIGWFPRGVPPDFGEKPAALGESEV